jgi:hypothetical protein
MKAIMTESGLAGQELSRIRAYSLRPLPLAGEPSPGADLDHELAEARSEGCLSGLVINGVAPGSEEERFLKHYIASYSAADRWGREFHAVLPTGRAAGGQPAPVGQIIIRWSATGECTASLIAAGPVTIAGQGTVGTLATALRERFGFGEVTGLGRDWSALELRKVITALLLMPEQDRQALAGVALIRMPQVDQAEENMYARYVRDQVFNENGVTDVAELQVGDGAFAHDDQMFVGTGRGRPFSCKRLLHEVGHAVEQAALRRANSRQMDTGSRLNKIAAAIQGGRVLTPVQQDQYKELAAAYDAAEAAQAAARGQGQRTVPLSRFVAHVTARNINRRITDYAGNSWPQKPQEFYAEAYSLWVLDPEFVTAFSADLAGFFDAGTYRPDA